MMPFHHRLFELAYWDAFWQLWFERLDRAGFLGLLGVVLTGPPYILIDEWRRR